MQNAGVFVDWVNMQLVDNVPADDNHSELSPRDSVSDVEMTVSRASSGFGWELMVDRPSHPIQTEAETVALQVAAGFQGGKKHELELGEAGWTSWNRSFHR